MNVNFKLKDHQGDESLLLVVVNYKGRRYVRSTGLKVTVAGWDQARQRHKDRHVNQAIGITRADHERVLMECMATGTDPIERLRVAAAGVPGRPPFVEFMSELGRNYQTAASHVHPSTRWEEITPAWMDAWVAMLIARGKARNAIRQYVASIKATMRKAIDQDLHQWDMSKFAKVRVTLEETTSIYLTVEELRRVAAVDLPRNMDNPRRLFLLGAYTGLRFSDYSRLGPDDFQGEYLTWRSRKTGELTTVPIPDAARAIVDKGMPWSLSIRRMNTLVREVARLAGIDDPVTWSRTVGRHKVVKVVPKWQLVTSHTARRSFATNLYLGGVDVISIMRFTGHRTTQSFMKYIRVTNQETAGRLKDKLKSFW